VPFQHKTAKHFAIKRFVLNLTYFLTGSFLYNINKPQSISGYHEILLWLEQIWDAKSFEKNIQNGKKMINENYKIPNVRFHAISLIGK
jgi:hypothetical protein